MFSELEPYIKWICEINVVFVCICEVRGVSIAICTACVYKNYRVLLLVLHCLLSSIPATKRYNLLQRFLYYLKGRELPSLDIFVDRAIVEVYANKQQAICRYVYPADPEDAVGVRLCGDPVSVALGVESVLIDVFYL